jgi:hypothetical protein
MWNYTFDDPKTESNSHWFGFPYPDAYLNKYCLRTGKFKNRFYGFKTEFGTPETSFPEMDVQ